MTLDEYLSNRQPFLPLSNHQRAELAASCVRKTLKDKEVLFREGTPSNWMYLVTDGVIRLDVSHPNGTRFMLTPLKAGMMTDGEIAENSIHPVTATAMKGAVIYLMPRPKMKALMRENPAFLESFLSLRDTSMRYISRVLSSTVSVTPDVRLAKIILTFYKIFGDMENPYIGYEFSQASLADTVACTRQSVAKILKNWREENLIDMRYKSIEIISPGKLCHIAGWNYENWFTGNGKADSWFSRF
ncbi:Crp/Fnr family transcriptional regulator [Alcanivorax sp. 1008]|uniref:Crp/Fnr family transcriptional regulator n=1 Tax=Alcanivorax sp. 1008 TaxID=2816853 RepID=UPI001DBFFD5E|nr:Crp/Fnr family transcriptional regulator [Alcanivorax sp. 1008]MCC1496485.1 Crp/Fnr family transcriptional regulator [Alcanivorax sp. 1008]